MAVSPFDLSFLLVEEPLDLSRQSRQLYAWPLFHLRDALVRVPGEERQQPIDLADVQLGRRIELRELARVEETPWNARPPV
jgi:hypothetical protein